MVVRVSTHVSTRGNKTLSAQTPAPTRDELSEDGRAKLVHRGSSFAQPDVYVAECGGRRVLVKDFAARPRWFRLLVGRRILRHEYRVLAQLADVSGVPQVYGLVDKDAVAMEYIDCCAPFRARREAEDDEIPCPGFFEELKQVLQRIHEHGIGHGDIRRKNILRGPGDAPYVIDFASAVRVDGPLRLARTWLFRATRVVDRITVLKLHQSFYEDGLTASEQDCLDKPPWYLRVGRYLRKNVYRGLLKPKRWRERMARLRARVEQRDP